MESLRNEDEHEKIHTESTVDYCGHKYTTEYKKLFNYGEIEIKEEICCIHGAEGRKSRFLCSVGKHIRIKMNGCFIAKTQYNCALEDLYFITL